MNYTIESLGDAMVLANTMARNTEEQDPDPYGFASDVEEEQHLDLLPSRWKAPQGTSLWNSRQTRRARLARVADMVTKGLDPANIADQLGVSRVMILQDITAIRREWQSSILASAQASAAEDIARLRWMFSKLVPSIERGDTKAINSATDIIRTIGDIVGYRQGVQVDVEQLVRTVAESEGFDPDKAVQIASRISIKLSK